MHLDHDPASPASSQKASSWQSSTAGIHVRQGIAKDPIHIEPSKWPLLQKETGNLHNIEVAAAGAMGIEYSLVKFG